MRLLIAGWQGQVARGLVEMAPGAPDVTACAVGRPALDICEAKTIERAMVNTRPDVVINSAAYTAVDKAESDVDQAYAMNRDGARALAEAAARAGVPIIHISTDYVFDGTKTEAYREDDVPNPVTVYGKSKLAGEDAVRQGNPRHVIVRTAWVHSPSGTNFVRTMLRLAGERDELRVVSDQTGNPTYAPHLCSAILEIARQVKGKPDDFAGWGLYHAAGTGTTTWHGLASEVMRLSASRGGPNVPVRAIATADYPTTAQRPANSALDCGKIRHAFGIALPAWEQGAEACVGRLLTPAA
jgi:dTDP-4-dehydrorhamnose reductase